MKSYGCIVLIASALFAIVLAEDEAFTEADKKAFKECKESEKPSDADLKAIMSHKFPESKEGISFLACIHEKHGAIKDGKINAEEMKKMIKRMKMDEKTFEAVAKEVDRCAGTVTGTDNSDLLKNFNKCMTEGMEKPKTN